MSLHDLIEKYDSPLEMLRSGPPFGRDDNFPFYPIVHSNWRDEQRAWATTAVLFNQSFHMPDLFISGSDTMRLLQDTSVNSYNNFRVGLAKQYLAVNEEGYFVGDAIMVPLDDNEVVVTGVDHSLNWLEYHAETGDYDVTLHREPASWGRPDAEKRFYRYQLEGPNAWKILEKASGRRLDHIRFFHTGEIQLAGHTVRALNHTMGGVPGQESTGLELFGPASERTVFVDAVLDAGKDFGLLQGGSLAYSSTQAESGWLGGALPAVYTSPSLDGYRRWLPDTALESTGLAMRNGSFQPDTVEGYYTTPWDLGYGRMVRFDHDFIGREALERMAAAPPRQKVWLMWNQSDTERILVDGELDRPSAPKPLESPAMFSRDEVRIGDHLVGVTQFHGYTVNIGKWVSLASVSTAQATDGTEVEIVWGDAEGGVFNPRVPEHTRTTVRATVRTTSPVV
ncbi:aminomethyl transferase family protein [Streptomyces sp. NPDC007162]|uniref:aminomethyl transferase family protein n=1 Tax=Streptomyces sp. NPDC007162 TaxID=3156917 RepID=UPI00340728CA